MSMLTLPALSSYGISTDVDLHGNLLKLLLSFIFICKPVIFLPMAMSMLMLQLILIYHSLGNSVWALLSLRNPSDSLTLNM
jgi:hypothetical protein